MTQIRAELLDEASEVGTTVAGKLIEVSINQRAGNSVQRQW
jgi:hypothetical protein